MTTKGSDFITIYTDASFRLHKKEAVVAWRGKCSFGSINGSKLISSHDVHHAEMMAILEGIKAAINQFPEVTGFFINSDNEGCVKAFWDFGGRNHKCPAPAERPYKEIKEILFLYKKWMRTKHVKAHTGQKDIRSYMNRQVDRMTRQVPTEPRPLYEGNGFKIDFMGQYSDWEGNYQVPNSDGFMFNEFEDMEQDYG
jgi:ribonuclease HI